MNGPLARSALAGIAGFLAYGGWAFYANLAHGEAVAMRAGWVQGTYSLVLTFAMTFVTEWLFAHLRSAAATVVVTSTALFATAYAIQWIAGTPEILMAIAPGWVVGSVYTSVYVWGLRRAARLGDGGSESMEEAP